MVAYRLTIYRKLSRNCPVSTVPTAPIAAIGNPANIMASQAPSGGTLPTMLATSQEAHTPRPVNRINELMIAAVDFTLDSLRSQMPTSALCRVAPAKASSQAAAKCVSTQATQFHGYPCSVDPNQQRTDCSLPEEGDHRQP